MITLLAFLFIRNLGIFVGWFSNQLGEIFIALKHARVVPAFQFPLILLLIYLLSLRNKKAKVFFAVVFALVGFTLAVLFASVNSVIFKDVLFSLVSMIKAGVLNAL